MAINSIVLADDESIQRDTLSTIIQRYVSADIRLCSNGRDALSLIEEELPDLLITDIRMPVMNGLDAARTIREMKRRDARRVPIIAMSANSFAEDIINSRMAGMNVHLAKPLDAEKMIVALKKCMADNSNVKLHEDL